MAAAPASAAKARVLTTLARLRTLADELQEGIRLAEEALELARRLGLAELEAHALATIGKAKLAVGGRGYLERALEIAVAANSPEASNILIFLGFEAAGRGDIRRAEELHLEACRMAERFGDRDRLRLLRGARVLSRWLLGHWDEAGRAADEFIAECEASPHLFEGTVRGVRANLRLARGDCEGALEDAYRDLEQGRQMNDVQVLLPGLIYCARCARTSAGSTRPRRWPRKSSSGSLSTSNTRSTWINSTRSHNSSGFGNRCANLVEQASAAPWKDAALAGADGD